MSLPTSAQETPEYILFDLFLLPQHTLLRHTLPPAPSCPTPSQMIPWSVSVWGRDQRHLLSPGTPAFRGGAMVQGEVSRGCPAL